MPYEVMRRFMEQVVEQVDRCRIAFRQGESSAVE
jgi:hypothetical protein